jgi:hypothetical protein
MLPFPQTTLSWSPLNLQLHTPRESNYDNLRTIPHFVQDANLVVAIVAAIISLLHSGKHFTSSFGLELLLIKVVGSTFISVTTTSCNAYLSTPDATAAGNGQE